MLSKCQNKWKITSNFCSLLRKAEELYKSCLFVDLDPRKETSESILSINQLAKSSKLQTEILKKDEVP